MIKVAVVADEDQLPSIEGRLNGPCQRPSPCDIFPGDWLHISHEGKIALGMIYRHQGDMYTFAIWEGCVLRLATAAYNQIGSRDEKLTAIFRGQVAVSPDYVERYVNSWLPKPPSPVTEEEPVEAMEPPQGSPKVQKFLFPKWDIEEMKAASVAPLSLVARRRKRNGRN